MLDGLLGRGFAARCKSLIKLTRSRIDVIRRKRNATQKFLKKDMADLLANGLDVNAYGRAEGLLVELILSSCYDFVDLCCQFLLKHMTIMQKQSECPEECQEAVSSLMFAAARFSDLPELRDLRKIFHERYGDSLDYFVNPEFSEKLAAKPSTMEKKIRLMQDMASEFSIKWDSRGFEQRMNLQDQPKQHGFSHATDASKILNNREITSKGENLNNPPKEKIGKVSEGKGFLNDTDGNNFRKNGLNLRNELEPARNVQTLLNKGALTMLKIDDQDAQRRRFGLAFDKNEEDNLLKPVKSGAASFVKGHKDVDGGFKRQNTAGKTSLERENGGNIPRLKQEFVPKSEGMYLKSDIKEVPHANNCNGNQGYTANSIGKAKGAEEQRSYNNVLPPPYVKPSIKPLKDDKYGHNSESISACPVVNEALTGTLKSVSHGAHFEKVLVGSSRSDNEKANIGPGAVISDKEITYPNGMPGYPIPKPKSVRRRHSKSRSAHGDVDLEDVGTRRRTSRSRRRDDSRRGLQILFDDEHDQNDEEERIIDKLLIHYSRKPSAYEPGKVRRKSRSRHAHGVGTDVGESPLNSSSAKYDEQSEIVLPPTRSISLPHEQTSAPMETVKVFTRAASFQPDRSTPARHVHPKLPEYEDLAARFAALRGN